LLLVIAFQLKDNVNSYFYAGIFCTRSSTRLIADVKKTHSLNEKKKAKKGAKLSAAKKLEQLAEDPEHAAIRMARNNST